MRILGSACGLGVEGSGWLAAPNVVVTNAHVVAGTDGDVVVRPRSGNVTLPARALAFDPVNDVAVLAVPGLSGPVLRLVDSPRAGTAGALLGYPRNGPFDVEPARIGQARRVISQDAYGQGPVERPMTPVRGLLRPGNSGGPIVDARGRVLTTVFASSRERDVRGGYGVPNSVVASVLERAVAGRGATVSTGPALADGHREDLRTTVERRATRDSEGMTTLRDAADEFLAQHRIAVAGVSRDSKQPANLIYRRLRDTGHEVFAVNPNAGQVEGDPCYASVQAVPPPLDGIVVVTTPEAAEQVVADAHEAGVPRVWLHRGMGPEAVPRRPSTSAPSTGSPSSPAAARACSARRPTPDTAGCG